LDFDSNKAEMIKVLKGDYAFNMNFVTKHIETAPNSTVFFGAS